LGQCPPVSDGLQARAGKILVGCCLFHALWLGNPVETILSGAFLTSALSMKVSDVVGLVTCALRLLHSRIPDQLDVMERQIAILVAWFQYDQAWPPDLL
jgi:hypothetical protein